MMRIVRIFSRSSDGPNPSRDWVLIFFISIVIFLSFILTNVYVYFQISHGDFFKVENDSQISLDVVDRNGLDKALSNFEDRAKRFGDIKMGATTLADPSI